MNRLLFILALPAIFTTMSCIGKSQNFDREPAVAGSFYPANKTQLIADLKSYFKGLDPKETQNPLAVIVPHAGYVFSGEVAASAFARINRDAKFKHIFIIGSSHTVFFEGAAIYTQGNFVTPLGKVAIDPLAEQLVIENRVFTDDVKPHEKEHSIEVELPFLQHWLKNDFTIVPIIIGGESLRVCSDVAAALTPYLNSGNLFVISSDFSHYPSNEIAIKNDEAMADAICSNSVDKFLRTKVRFENGNYPNLRTSMCAWTSMLPILSITNQNNGYVYQKVMYRNSSSSEFGDDQRVVGYNAIALYANNNYNNVQFTLDMQAKQQLLELARATVTNVVQQKRLPNPNVNELSPLVNQLAGAFVTLNIGGNLRGCIGNFSTNRPLYKVIIEMAQAAAIHDYRFPPVSEEELDSIDIEISVLTPMKRIKSLDELELGKHGIYIKKGAASGTFLPQVATETGWDKEQFVSNCSYQKACIGRNGWKDPQTELYVYEAIVFNESLLK